MVLGVATPTLSGALPSEGIVLMRSLKDLNIVGMDINTKTPLHAPAGVSANFAAILIAEGLGVLS